MSMVSRPGGARLDAAIRQAEDRGDPEAWLTAVLAKYEREKRLGAASQELAAFRGGFTDRLEALRARYRSRAGRLWVGEVAENVVGTLLKDGLAAGTLGTDEAFALSEASRARVLLDFMTAGFREVVKAEASEARRAERGILEFAPRQMMDPLAAQLQLSSRLPLRNADSVGTLEALYARLGAGFEAVSVPTSLRDVQHTLLPGEALIEYIIPYHPLHPAIELWVVAATRATTKLIRASLSALGPGDGFIGILRTDDNQPMDSSPLGNTVVSTRVAIERGDASRFLRLLGSVLVDPLIEAGLEPEKFDRWIIVPHGVLHAVPWGALLGGDGRPLATRVALVNAPSASVWVQLRRRGAVHPKSFIGFGDPLLPRSGLDPLFQARAEIGEIERTLTARGLVCRGLVGAEATEAAFRDQAPGAHIVHLATHGSFPEHDAIDFHEVLLAAAGAQDGRVRADDLRTMDLTAAWLVTLSVCNGGVYRFGPGDEPYGLMPALLAAGARNVLATLWPVDDAATRRLMVECYRDLPEKAPGDALTAASRRLLQRKPPPTVRDWACFVMIGAGDPAG